LEGGERLLEVAGQHPAQIENRQRVEAFGPPRPFRQDRRGEADFLVSRDVSPVARLGAPELDWPNPVWTARCGPWPCPTMRSQPSGNFKSFYWATKASASAISTC
jgi:hypothetical protein